MMKVGEILKKNEILRIALPAIVSNITVPLLGLIDIAIVGHLGSAIYIGAIAVGSTIFNLIYWIFGFLRMGTSGMTSQAYGRKDTDETAHMLVRSAGIALAIALLLLLFQIPVINASLFFIHPTSEVKELATLYFYILIWGAPATLGLYAFTGWFIGMQNSRFPMYIAITQNLVNIAVSLLLVCGLGMKVAGVAIGTLIAQYAGLTIAVLLWFRKYRNLCNRLNFKGIWTGNQMAAFFSINRHLFLRTLCLVFVTLFFTSAGARQGNLILAVNTLLLQFFMIFSYFTDGFAYAGEALTGRQIGARNFKAIRHTIKDLFVWGIVLMFIFSAVYALFGNYFIHFLTNEKEVVEASVDYFWWVVAIPAASILAFTWDGIFIGATAGKQMFISMATAAIIFFVIYYFTRNYIGNHAVWLAFISYLLMRGIAQTILTRNIKSLKV